MTPKLYLIESEEREGLVKIGFAGVGEYSTEDDAVYERVRRYAVGISDTSTVHETPGAAIFEKYFHTFVSDKQKPVHIKFKFLGKSYRPIEWFVLPPHVSAAFIDAFSKEHPMNIEQLNLDDLPIFLSGVLSAVHWHAKRISSLEPIEMVVREELLSNFEGAQTWQTAEVGQEQNEIYGPVELEQGSIPYSLPPGLIHSVGQTEKLKVEMLEMQEMEVARTIIALVAAAMVFFLLITGATVAGCLFAIIASLLLAGWPNLQPFATAALVDLSNRLKSGSEKSRHRANRYDD